MSLCINYNLFGKGCVSEFEIYSPYLRNNIKSVRINITYHYYTGKPKEEKTNTNTRS